MQRAIRPAFRIVRGSSGLWEGRGRRHSRGVGVVQSSAGGPCPMPVIWRPARRGSLVVVFNKVPMRGRRCFVDDGSRRGQPSMKTVCASATVVSDGRHPATFPRRGWCSRVGDAGDVRVTGFRLRGTTMTRRSTRSRQPLWCSLRRRAVQCTGWLPSCAPVEATRISANLSGFKPNTSHGMHIHEKGDCSARDAASAGEHFNPTSSQHGSPSAAPHHGGDLGNVTADSKERCLQALTSKMEPLAAVPIASSAEG
jgi:hypothetical protein